MNAKKRIAFIGFGAIGQDVMAGLNRSFAAGDIEYFILVRAPEQYQTDFPALRFSSHFEELHAFKPDLVVEVASQQAAMSYLPDCLTLGATVLITSIGALADGAFHQQLLELAQAHQARIILPSGAIAGLDYLEAVRDAPDLEVRYESRKPVSAWVAELAELGLQPEEIKEPLILFEGSAEQAARRYPQNLNVAATLALSGVGMQNTKVAVIVDPQLQQNTHVIQVRSQYGTLQLEVSNVPSPTNPKSSWVVAQSVESSVRKALLG